MAALLRSNSHDHTSRVRLLFAGLVSLVVAGMLALGMSAPAGAVTVTNFRVKLVTMADAPLTGWAVYPIELNSDGTPVAFQDPTVGTAVAGKPGYFDLDSLSTGNPYTLYLVPTGDATLSGTAQYLGGTPGVDGATTFSPSLTDTFLAASIATGATITGKVTSPSGAVLKNAEVDAYEYDGTNWVSNSYTLTNSKGVFTLNNADPGSYKFEFYSPSNQYPPIFSGGNASLAAATPIFIAAGTTATVNQKFTAGTGSITGTAYLHTVDDDGEFHRAKVTAVAFPVTSAPGDDTTIDTDKGVASALASSKGAWAVKNLTPGRYVVQLQPYYGGQFKEYLTNSDDEEYADLTPDSPDMSLAAIYTVTAGHTVSTGSREFTGFDGTLGSEPDLTVVDTSDSQPISGAIVQISPDTAPYAYVYGTSGVDGTVPLYFDPDDQVATSEDEITEFGPYPLTPGWYDITVIDPTGAHEPYKQHGFLDFGEQDIPIPLDPVNTVPAVTAGTIDTTDPTAGTTYNLLGTSTTRDDATLTYQWLRGGAPIYGATSTSYASTGGDVGTVLSVRVTASSFGFAPVSDTAVVGGATPEAEVQGDPAANTSVPTISPSGNVIIGTVLTAHPGSWTVDGHPATGLSFTYLWSDGSGGQTHTVTSDEVHNGADITVVVTAHKTGFGAGEVASAAGVVTAVIAPQPVNTKAPTVSQKTVNGVTTYTPSPGTWNVAGLSYIYDWSIGTSWHADEPTLTSTELPAKPWADPLKLTVYESRDGYADNAAAVIVTKGAQSLIQASDPVVEDVTAPHAGDVVSGTDCLNFGETYTVASPGTWSVNGDEYSPSSYTYQWYRMPAGGTLTKISGATTGSYKITAADMSATNDTEITVVITAVSAGYQTTAGGQTQVGEAMAIAFPSTPTATLSGLPIAGAKVSVSVSSWGVSGVSLAYQWFDCEEGSACTDSSTTDDYQQIAGATKSSLTVDTNSGYVFARVTGSKVGYYPVSVDTEPGQVQNGPYVFTAPPKISGTAAVGVKLTAIAPKWHNAGIKNHYVWETQECAPDACGDDWVPITGSGVSSYTPTAADYGDGGVSIRLQDLGTLGSMDASGGVVSAPQHIGLGTIKVVKAPTITVSGGFYVVSDGTYSVSGGEFEKVTWRDGDSTTGERPTDPADAGKAVYADVLYVADGYNAITTRVIYQKGATTNVAEAIDGGTAVGDILSPSVDQPFDDNLHSARALTYQWYSNGTKITGSAGTGSTFKVSSSYYGKKITVTIKGSSDLYQTGTVTSSSVTIAKGSFGTPAAPAIQSTGTLEPGVKASVTLGDYGTTGVTFGYLWQRRTSPSAAWTNISGATKSTYTPVATDAGDQLQVIVTATKSDYTTSQLPSAAADVAYPATLATISSPVLGGSGMVGQVLNVTTGSWNTPGLTYAYQWYRNSVAIPGATTATWTPTATTMGDEITVVVTASRVGYASVGDGSNAISVAQSDALHGVTSPVVTASSGVEGPGVVLKVTTGTWSVDGLTFTYQWHDEDGDIPGATTDTYTMTGSEPGLITVAVVASRAGYLSQGEDAGAPF